MGWSSYKYHAEGCRGSNFLLLRELQYLEKPENTMANLDLQILTETDSSNKFWKYILLDLKNLLFPMNFIFFF